MNKRTAGIAAASVAGVAALIGTGVAVERRVVGRARNVADPYANVKFGDRHSAAVTVTANAP